MELLEDITNRELGKKKHTCRVCGSVGEFSSYLIREMMQGTKEEFEYFACDNCGCLQITQIPDNMEKYYTGGYYSYKEQEFEASRIGSTRETKKEKVLDVGCGSGKWLIRMANEGYRDLWGCDPFIERDLRYGDYIHIRRCSIHEMKGEKEYDIIHMGDSLEHMEDPIPVLRCAANLLKDDGTIVLHVPVFPNIIFDMYGAHWFQIDAPRHLHIPAKKTLEYMAEQSGLMIAGMDYDARMLHVLISWFYQHGVTYHEISEELISSTFSEESIEEIRRLNDETNRLGYGDAAGVVMKKRL